MQTVKLERRDFPRWDCRAIDVFQQKRVLLRGNRNGEALVELNVSMQNGLSHCIERLIQSTLYNQKVWQRDCTIAKFTSV